jgi:hypothetical protein
VREKTGVRTMFAAYWFVIVLGIVAFAVAGFTHS